MPARKFVNVEKLVFKGFLEAADENDALARANVAFRGGPFIVDVFEEDMKPFAVWDEDVAFLGFVLATTKKDANAKAAQKFEKENLILDELKVKTNVFAVYERTDAAAKAITLPLQPAAPGLVPTMFPLPAGESAQPVPAPTPVAEVAPVSVVQPAYELTRSVLSAPLAAEAANFDNQVRAFTAQNKRWFSILHGTTPIGETDILGMAAAGKIFAGEVKDNTTGLYYTWFYENLPALPEVQYETGVDFVTGSVDAERQTAFRISQGAEITDIVHPARGDSQGYEIYWRKRI